MGQLSDRLNFLLPRVAAWYLAIFLYGLWASLMARHSPFWDGSWQPLLLVAISSYHLSRLDVPPRWLLVYGAGAVLLLPDFHAFVRLMFKRPDLLAAEGVSLNWWLGHAALLAGIAWGTGHFERTARYDQGTQLAAERAERFTLRHLIAWVLCIGLEMALQRWIALAMDVDLNQAFPAHGTFGHSDTWSPVEPSSSAPGFSPYGATTTSPFRGNRATRYGSPRAAHTWPACWPRQRWYFRPISRFTFPAWGVPSWRPSSCSPYFAHRWGGRFTSACEPRTAWWLCPGSCFWSIG